MQILRSTSRSISQDQFYRRQLNKKYQLHAKMISEIHSHKTNMLEQTKKINQVLQMVKKAKSTSKMFRQKESQDAIKKQNKHLLQKLYNVQPTMKVSKSELKIKPITVSNWHSKKKTQEQIKEQNSRLKKRVDMLSSANQKQYRKKIQEDIKQYLSLKNHVRKLKSTSTNGRRQHNYKPKEEVIQNQKLKSQTSRTQKALNLKIQQTNKQRSQNQENFDQTKLALKNQQNGQQK